MAKSKKNKYTVGLWMNINTHSGKPMGLQMWHIYSGIIKKPKLIWHTVVLAKNEDEALQLGQAEYAGTNDTKNEQAA